MNLNYAQIFIENFAVGFGGGMFVWAFTYGMNRVFLQVKKLIS